MSKNYKTPLQSFYHWESTTPDKEFLRQSKNSVWTGYTWKEVANQSRRMAAHLKSLDFPAGSNIALWSSNCVHWVMADLAIWMAGHVSVPLYPTLTPDTAKYILEHSEAKLLFVGKLDKWEGMKGGVPAGTPCVTFPYETTNDYDSWDSIIAKTKPLAESPPRSLDEIATIIYTSGTTGNPKGVVHKFKSMAALAWVALELYPAVPDERFFSYLPLSHVAERGLIEINALARNGHVSFTDNLDTFPQDLADTKPYIFFSVPRLWSKFQEKILSKIPQKKLDLLLSIPILNWFIRRKILKTLGLHKCKYPCSGAAPIPTTLLEWYKKLGLEILEGYGMTENFIYSNASRPGETRIGTVGKALPGCECKISDSGEILIKNDSLMEEYYKMPEATAATFDNGFLKTGDQGALDSDGYLKITGRVKDLFKTAKGKYVAPSPIEMKYQSNQYVELACLVGGTIPQPYALVCLSELAPRLSKEELTKELEDLRTSTNSSLDHHERVDKVIVMKDLWSVENKILTPTLKIKRNVVEANNGPKLDAWEKTKQSIIWES